MRRNGQGGRVGRPIDTHVRMNKGRCRVQGGRKGRPSYGRAWVLLARFAFLKHLVRFTRFIWNYRNPPSIGGAFLVPARPDVVTILLAYVGANGALLVRGLPDASLNSHAPRPNCLP